MRYDVHIYPICRVKVTGVEANSHTEAITKAEELVADDLYPLFYRESPTPRIEHTDYSEDIFSYLVDEEGDEKYDHTTAYGPDGMTPVSYTAATSLELYLALNALLGIFDEEAAAGRVWDDPRLEQAREAIAKVSIAHPRDKDEQ